MGNKPLQHIAGIGDAYGGRLAERGFTNAFQLYGQYLKHVLAKVDKSHFAVSSKSRLKF